MVSQQATADDARLHAGWKIQQPDELGPVYYFYPDGVIVIQNPRRREFVSVGRWAVNDQDLVLFDVAPRNTTLSEDEINDRRGRQRVYSLVFESDAHMRWTSEDEPDALMLHRIVELPNRDEKSYWGFREIEDVIARMDTVDQQAPTD